MRQGLLNRSSGFTLIELVATIAIAGVVMVMILPYFQSGITDSHRPARWLQDAVTVQRAMESINGAYGKILNKDNAALQALSNSIGPAGSSFPNSPFGTYAVLENAFITFHNGTGNEQAGGTVMLKISICSPATPGHQLTQLFTVQVDH
jgi:prepilin-type N-terminal cleavage/methylation domain-containing protein